MDESKYKSKIEDLENAVNSMVSSYDDHFNRILGLVDKSGSQVKECIDMVTLCQDIVKQSKDLYSEALMEAKSAKIISVICGVGFVINSLIMIFVR